MSSKRKGPGGGRPGGRPDDPWQDPGLLRWMKRCETELVPMVRGSRMTASILPDEDGVDLKFAIELGISMMMDKPIIAMVMPGRAVPDHIVRAADAIIEFDPDDPAGSAKRFQATIEDLGFTRDDSGYAMEMRQNPPLIQVPDELEHPPARYELTDQQIGALAEKLEDYFTDAVHVDAKLVSELIKAYSLPVQGDDR